MEEITAGDIMLNNWFHVNGYPMYVDSIFRDTVYLEFEGNEGDVWEENIKDLKPIPLTDDILVKAGFSIGGYNIVEVTHPDYPRLFFVIIDDTASVGWNYNVSGTLKECEGSMIEIKYLHQLQNLFKSLTGNDLKIEV